MSLLIRNKSRSPFTLPHPMRGVLAPSQGIVLNVTRAQVEAQTGPLSSSLGLTEVRQVGGFDDAFLGELLTPGIETSEIEANAVDGSKLATGVVRQEVVAGQDEVADDTIPVTDLAAGDELVAVMVNTAGVLSQRALSDFTVGAGELTVVANPADNAANQYLVSWVNKTP